MPPIQQFLDPDRQETRGKYVSNSPILPKTRRFGLYPNIDEWLPGDLLLVSQVQRGWTHRLIYEGQIAGGYASEDARWGHAAIYLGDGEICEAMPAGIQHRSVEHYVDGQWLIRVRRDQTLTMDQRWRIAVRGLTKLRTAYGFGSLLRLAPALMNSFNTVSYALRPRQTAFICSELYANAYSPITGKVLQNRRSGEITPAFLSSTPLLEDVELYWLKI